MTRRTLSVLLTLTAFLVVWLALTGPDQPDLLSLRSFVRIPLEGLALVVLVLVLPPRGRRVLAVAAGALLGLVVILRVFDLGFYEVLNRPFDLVIDWQYLDSAVGVVNDSAGRGAAVVAVVVAVLLAVLLLVVMPLAVLRVSSTVRRHPSESLRTVGVLAVVWVLCAVLGVHAAPEVPVASTGTATYAYGQVSRIPSEIRDQRRFAVAAAHDPRKDTRGDQLLTGLRGKDVVFAFVESYGRVAVQGSSFSPGVRSVLRSGTEQLQAAGFSTRSAFLTSPTFGAVSWLAHSTLQSGLWVDSQQRYDTLVTSKRQTLTSLFGRAGWRTVADVPANTHDWPQGEFYGYDHVYDSGNVGYDGPRFGYPTMPDQYTLDAFHRLELAPRERRPVMAEIDLVSSHAPWSRTPHLIDQELVGDGSVYDGMPETLPSEQDIWPDPDRVRRAYGDSIEYSLRSLVSFVQHYGDDDLVLVLLGDHQPATVVSGRQSGFDVPVTVVARDPQVLDRISGWGWQAGMLPRPDAPVWRMDAFRDRFLTAFGPH